MEVHKGDNMPCEAIFKTADIHIRDPYILTHQGRYYLYGTRGATAWGPAEGFDCYISDDLENWEGPIEIFRNDGTFWATSNYWAPECYYYNNSFFLFATFRSDTRRLGIQVLRSDKPTGPFAPHSDGPLTSPDCECLDGTLFFDGDKTPWLVFSHSFEQNPMGGMCAMPVQKDLAAAAGPAVTLFHASEAPWAGPFPYAKKEFGCEGDVFLSDGPTLYRTASGRLLMLWSSFGKKGYAVGIAHSDNGQIDGQWIHHEQPLFDENGGHGMIFTALDGTTIFTCHYPNTKDQERPTFFRLVERDDQLILTNEEDI